MFLHLLIQHIENYCIIHLYLPVPFLRLTILPWQVIMVDGNGLLFL
jgi:hypothetical protein